MNQPSTPSAHPGRRAGKCAALPRRPICFFQTNQAKGSRKAKPSSLPHRRWTNSSQKMPFELLQAHARIHQAILRRRTVIGEGLDAIAPR